MKVIGLCGGSGSGKGEVGSLFLSHGIPVIDTDDVYHKLTTATSPCLDELVACFGEEIIDTSGALNRAELAKIVFAKNSQNRLEELNRISHKHILSKTRDMLSHFSDMGYEFAVVDAPLLFESGFNSECDIVISVVADKSVRVKRIMERDSLSRESAESRITSQLTDEFLISNSDFVIKNDGTLEELSESFESTLKKINNI